MIDISLFLKLISFSLEISDNINQLTTNEKENNHKDIIQYGKEENADSFDVKQKIIKTKFKDKQLIQKAIIATGLKLNPDNKDIISFLEKGSMKFQKNAGGSYDVIITGNVADNEINALLNELTKEYTKNVQEDTYNKVIENLKKQNMTIENETVTDDDSIILTVDL